MSVVKHQDYRMFDEMSTEQLEEILRLDSYGADHDTYDADAILYIMEMVTRRKQQASTEERQDAARKNLQELKKIYLPGGETAPLYQFDNEGKSEEQTEMPQHKRKSAFSVMRRVGWAAAAVAAIFGLMITAQAAGLDIFGAIARWTDETFQFSVQEDDGGSAWFEDYQDDLTSVGLSEEFLPTWIPEGYLLEEIQTFELSGQTEVYILFANSDHLTFDILITIYEDPADMETQIFEKDDSPLQTLQIDNKTIYLFENLGPMTAVCQYQNIVYSIVGELSQDTLLKLFASIGDD